MMGELEENLAALVAEEEDGLRVSRVANVVSQVLVEETFGEEEGNAELAEAESAAGQESRAEDAVDPRMGQEELEDVGLGRSVAGEGSLHQCGEFDPEVEEDLDQLLVLVPEGRDEGLGIDATDAEVLDQPANGGSLGEVLEGS